MIVLTPRKRDLLDRSPLLCGGKIYMEKGEENHTTFVWLSSLWLLPRSASQIPLLWAVVSCPYHSISHQIPLFYFLHFNWYPHRCHKHSTPAISAPRWNLAMPLLLTHCQQQKRTGAASNRWEKINVPFFRRCYDLIIFNKLLTHKPCCGWYLSPQTEYGEAAAGALLLTT